MTTAVKRACDACHRRKVKCDGLNPCRNCGSAQLACTYNAIPQKKGPKGSRAKVISELRENQRQTSLAAKIHNAMMGGSADPQPTQTICIRGTPGLLSMDVIKSSMDFYFDYMYPTAPILARDRLRQDAMYMEQKQCMDTYCLLSSLAAYTMIQPGGPLPAGDPGFNVAAIPGANIAATQILIEETLRVRKGLDYMGKPSFNSLCTLYFLFAAHLCLEYNDRAWFYLREATTLVFAAGMHKEETYAKLDIVEASRRRRLFWLFFISERLFALQHGKPLTLEPTIRLPTISDDPSDDQSGRLNSFCLLANTFRSFDFELARQWKKLRDGLDPTAITDLNKKLSQVMPSLANMSNPTQDLMENQQWLKNIQWRMNYQDGTLDPGNQEAQTSVQYGHDYTPAINSMLSQPAVGRSMLQNLLSITQSMTEYLASCAPERIPYSKGPRAYLNEILNTVSVIRNGDHRFLHILLIKIHEALFKVPRPMLLEMPEALVAQNLASADLFDGFGTAGLGQVPMDFGGEEKRYIADINTSAAMNGGMTSMSDMPFSPAIMSPGGMEFPQQLQDFNTPLDIMSPTSQNMPSGHNMMTPPGQSQPQAQTPQSQQGSHMQLTPQQIQSLTPQQLQMAASLNPQSFNAMMNLLPQGALNNMTHSPPTSRPPQAGIQRANSFVVQQTPHSQQIGIRTVGDFHALQRVKTEPQQIPQMPTTQGMGGLPPGQMPLPSSGLQPSQAMSEIDFSALR